MRNYITYESTGHTIFVSLFNGNQIILPNNTNYTNKDLKRIFQKNNMDMKIPTQEIYKRKYLKQST